MPGTTYTRKGPENDPAGRLADFCRFAVEETDAIATPDDLPRGVIYHLAEAREHLAAIADAMSGYTTADDD